MRARPVTLELVCSQKEVQHLQNNKQTKIRDETTAGVCVAKGGRTLGVEQCFGDGMGGGRMAVGKEAQKNGRCNFFLAAAVTFFWLPLFGVGMIGSVLG